MCSSQLQHPASDMFWVAQWCSLMVKDENDRGNDGVILTGGVTGGGKQGVVRHGAPCRASPHAGGAGNPLLCFWRCQIHRATPEPGSHHPSSSTIPHPLNAGGAGNSLLCFWRCQIQFSFDGSTLNERWFSQGGGEKRKLFSEKTDPEKEKEKSILFFFFEISHTKREKAFL
jgi:hypothetical protein